MNRKLYRRVAKKYGVSVEDVKREMQAAIDEAYKNPNIYAQSVDFKGGRPTIDEFIQYVAEKVKTEI